MANTGPDGSFQQAYGAEAPEETLARLKVVRLVLSDTIDCLACWGAENAKRATIMVGESVLGTNRPFVICMEHASKVADAMGGELAQAQFEKWKRDRIGK